MLKIQNQEDLTLVIVVLGGVLKYMKERQLEVVPVSQQTNLLWFVTNGYEHLQLVSFNLRNERKKYLLDLTLWVASESRLRLKLVLMDLHSLYLADVVEVHDSS